MAGSKKGEAVSTSSFEVDSQDMHLRSKLKGLKRVDGIRVGVTVLALCMGISILGLSGDALNVYNSTSLPHEYLLPLWPDEFNLRPTVALVVGAVFITIANIASLMASKVSSVRNAL
jgi:hypothetical protein